MPIIEIFGYLGSVTVAISLMMSNIIKLRWLNLIGALIFTIYGFIISAYPVFALNGFICCVNIYYLFKLYKKENQFSFLEIEHTNPVLHKFISIYESDIQKFYPNNIIDFSSNLNYLFIFRGVVPVGIFIYSQIEDNANIIIDYATPEYRDLKNSQYLFYKNKNYFIKKGIKQLLISTNSESVITYLKKLGFSSSQDEKLLVKKIN